MYRLTLDQANSMIAGALSKAADEGLRPLTVVAHDPGGKFRNAFLDRVIFDGA